MKSIHQTYRRRLRAAFGVLLMLLSGLLLGLSYAQYSASQEALRKLNSDFSLLATPTERYRFRYVGSYEDRKKMSSSLLDPKAADFIESLPARIPEIVAGISRSDLVTATCAALQPFLSGHDYISFSKTMDPSPIPLCHTENDANYLAILEVEVSADERISSHTDSFHTHYTGKAVGTVIQVISLPQGIADPTGREIDIRWGMTKEEYEEAGLSGLGRFLVAGSYTDSDLSSRMFISYHTGGKLKPEEIDTSKFEPISKAEEEASSVMKGYLRYKTDEFNVLVGPEAAASLGCSAISLPTGVSSGTVRRIPEGKTAEQVMQEPQWQEYLRMTEANQHAFPVLAVENLDHMVLFSEQEVEVPQG